MMQKDRKFHETVTLFYGEIALYAVSGPVSDRLSGKKIFALLKFSAAIAPLHS